MIIHTTQMAKWRKACGEFIDITVKSGDKLFAPSWNLLSDYKSGKCNQEVYTKRYYEEMRKSYLNNKEHWLDFLHKEEVTVACYCASGKFCHRHLFVDIVEKLCNHLSIEFTRGGEI